MPTVQTKDPREVARERQCQYRRGGTCDILNTAAGFRFALHINDCDRCCAMGGADGDESSAYRRGLLDGIIARVKANLRRSGKVVIEAILREHCTAEEREMLLADPEVRWATSRSDRWRAVAHTFEMAFSYTRSALSKGFTGKRVDLKTKEIRRASCLGAGGVDRCGAMDVSRDGQHFMCGECGCGEHAQALLGRVDGKDTDEYTKLDYPYLECPRHRPGFSNADLTINGAAPNG